MNYRMRDDIPEDEEVTSLMREHGVGRETAEQAQEYVVEGLDEEDAIELAEEP